LRPRTETSELVLLADRAYTHCVAVVPAS
jgi:hypothetical protein